MDKETIEEAKFKSYKEYWNEYHTQLVKSNFLNGFEEGAKWQQERSYSEEDMRRAYSIGWITRERFNDLSPDIIYPKGLDYEEKQDYAFNLWFEQFKNKL